MVDMGQVVPAQIGHSEFAEHVIENRRRIFDGVVALDHAGRFEPGECESLDIFLKRNAILQPE